MSTEPSSRARLYTSLLLRVRLIFIATFQAIPSLVLSPKGALYTSLGCKLTAIKLREIESTHHFVDPRFHGGDGSAAVPKKPRGSGFVTGRPAPPHPNVLQQFMGLAIRVS